MKASQGDYTTLFIFLMLVLGVGFAIGPTIRPASGIRRWQSHGFTPPNWLFAPAWTLVYILIVIAGWRRTINEGFNSPAFRFLDCTDASELGLDTFFLWVSPD